MENFIKKWTLKPLLYDNIIELSYTDEDTNNTYYIVLETTLWKSWETEEGYYFRYNYFITDEEWYRFIEWKADKLVNDNEVIYISTIMYLISTLSNVLEVDFDLDNKDNDLFKTISEYSTKLLKHYNFQVDED